MPITDITLRVGGGSALQNALGTTSADVVEVCRLSSINKWSLRKSINYGTTQYASLTDAQMVGPDSETNEGYYYGIKFSDNSFTTIAAIHTSGITLFDYHRLELGNVARLDDFYNYDPNATADVSMQSVPSSVYFGSAFSVNLLVNKSQYGVPFSEVMKKVIGGGIGEGSYLMMLASKKDYVSSASAGKHSYTRLSSSPINFNTNATVTCTINGLSLQAGDYYVSFYLHIPRNSMEVDNMPEVGEWIDAYETLDSSNPIVVPEGHKRLLTVKPKADIPYVSQITVSTTSTYILISYVMSQDVSSYQIRVSGTIDGRDVSVEGNQRLLLRWNWSDINGGFYISPIAIDLTFETSTDNFASSVRRYCSASVIVPLSGQTFTTTSTP